MAGLAMMPLAAQAPAEGDPRWLVDLAKATCVAFLIEPEKAEAVATARGYTIDKLNGWFLEGKEGDYPISIILVRLQREPLTFRQCIISTTGRLKYPEDRTRMALQDAFPGLTFQPQAAIKGLFSFAGSPVEIAGRTLVLYVQGAEDNGVKQPIDGLIVNRMR
jgi:hypothetical protein